MKHPKASRWESATVLQLFRGMTDSFWSNSFGWSDDALPICIEDVIERWWDLLARECPWSAMSYDDAHGNMRGLLRELINQARDLDDRARVRRLTVMAFEHGVFRGGQGCRREDLICELELLVDVVDASLLGLGVPPGVIRDALVCLEPDLNRAQSASLRGWRHSTSTDQLARNAAIDRLIDGLR